MTTYQTGNPVPSAEGLDFFDNCQALDEAMNALGPEFTDRFGRIRKTWAAVEASINEALITPKLYAREFAPTEENTAVVAGLQYTTVVPVDFTATGIIVALATPQTSGAEISADVQLEGSSVLSGNILVPNASYSSLDHGTQATVTTDEWTAGDKLTFHVGGVGDGTAQGVKFIVLGYNTP